MKIVIAGAGDVGTHLAKLLTHEEQDIIVIDRDAEKLALLDANYNLMTCTGSPTSFKTLREAGVGRCDLFIGVTPYENDNIVACTIAKKLGAGKTVARIDTFEFMQPGNLPVLKDMGVDQVIYPEYLAAQEIRTALRRSWVRHWFELHDGEIIVVGVKLRNNAPIVGLRIMEFGTANHNFHIAAIKRGHETIIPRGSDTIETGDILYITCTRQHIDDLLPLTGKVHRDIRRITVMGGGKITVRLAALLGNQYRIKIIDHSLERCQQLSELCPEADIVHGDARDIELLADESVGQSDAFIALTGSSEANILTCLTAKEMGVKKTVAEVENIQYISQAEGLNIGTIINKKLLASSTIFQLLLDSDTTTSKCLALSDAEVNELEVKPGARIAGKPVKDLKLTRDMTIAGLIRNGRGSLVGGMTVIQPGDHVVVFSLSGSLHKVEKLFN